MKTPEIIANRVINKAIQAGTVRSWDAPNDTLMVWDAHRLITAAIEADREQIIEEMRVRSHPDDWGVPCIYIDTFARRLRGKLEDTA